MVRRWSKKKKEDKVTSYEYFLYKKALEYWKDGARIAMEAEMTFGKYKGKQLKDLPPRHLKWLYHQKWLPEKHPEIYEHLKALIVYFKHDKKMELIADFHEEIRDIEETPETAKWFLENPNRLREGLKKWDELNKLEWIRLGKPLWTEKELRESPAFQKLTKSAIHLLLDFYGKVKSKRIKSGAPKGKWEVINNGEIACPYSEGKRKLGISKQTFRTARDQLVEVGFLDIAHSGGGYDGDLGRYALSNRWRKYGTDDFIELKRPKDTRVGRGFSVVHERLRREREHKEQSERKQKAKLKLIRRKKVDEKPNSLQEKFKLIRRRKIS